jgi:SAM-dependent methyltransferase
MPTTEHVDYDAELRLYQAELVRHLGLSRGDRVLDIGCGEGETTRTAARMADEGHVLGIDISAAMIERARRATDAANLRNVAYEIADAERHPFPAHAFDVAISRFGTMFFAHPVAAFANIGRALGPGGRLVMMVWQSRDRNDWALLIDDALPAMRSEQPPSRFGAFSLGDPDTVRAILTESGFGGIELVDVNRPVYYGRNVEEALAWVSSFANVAEALQRLDRSAADRVRSRLLEQLAARMRPDGVWIDARAWIVSASR